jgi:hypothetical protein
MSRFIVRTTFLTITLLTTPAWAISIPCGTSIDAAIASNPPGTVFQLAANCTYSGQTFHTKDNIQLLGAGAGSTILDGGHASIAMTNGAPPYGGDGTAGVIIDGVTIQNYGPDTAENTSSQFYTWNGWIIRNSTITGGGGAGINLVGSATLANSLITGNREIGITGNLSLTGALSPTTINGNEIANNNTRRDNPDNSASGVKMVGGGASVVATNNYIHDNLGTGLWFDIGVAGATVQGNSVIHNSYHGIMWEISNGPADISGNVVNDNGWDSRMPTQGQQIFVSSAANANVHDNNIRVPVAIGGWSPNGIRLNADNRSDAVLETGDTFHNNTVTFLGSSGNEGFANNSSVSVVGTSSNNNAFYVVNTDDLHWFWNTGATPTSWASYKSSSRQDANSTLAIGDASVPGCLKRGCTGSGWPVAGNPTANLSVQIIPAGSLRDESIQPHPGR